MRESKQCKQLKMMTIKGELHVAKCELTKNHSEGLHEDATLQVKWEDNRVGQR